MTNFRKTSVPFLLAAFLMSAMLFSTEGCRGGVKALIAKFHHRKSKSRSNSTDYADNVAQVVSTPKLNILRIADFSNYQPQVQQFYENRNYELAWTRDGKPTDEATAMIQLFADAAKKGLQPEDYDSSHWPQLVQQLATIRSTHDTSDAAETTVAQFDAAMTISAMRYVSDLHFGRINPQALNFDIDVPARRAAFDLAAFVDNELVDADDVASTISKLEPQNPAYQATEQALGKYLSLAQQPQETLPDVAKPVAVGAAYPGVAQLAARLQLEGDASPGETPQRYDQATTDGVKRFQERHGLTADGKLNQATVDALNVPVQQRVQQLGYSLERWRWLPDNFVQPRVMVNLPEFIVRTYDADHNLAFKMKVVDGQAKGNHDTPMFVRTMKYLNFRPYWNLPPSIIKKDLARHLGDRSYLERNNYEVVGKSGQVVTDWTADAVEHNRYLVRQKPGPKNSLGLVKFMFPNEYDIYLHSTPEMSLFNLTRRDRSHGCVRLQDAEKMANWVLNGQGDWDAAKIHEAMYGPEDGSQANDNKQVSLQTQLPVVLTYLTANADEDGTIHFFEDIYGYDKQLENALAQPRPYSQEPVKINPKLTPGETE